jgi:hypothetical protein
MYIQSSFKDYYDSAASSGIDKTIVYERTSKKVHLEAGFFIDGLPQYFSDDLGNEKYINGRSHPDRNYCKWMIIGFCGIQYLGVFNTTADDVKVHNMAYFGEDILTLDWQPVKSHWWYRKPRIVIEQMLNQWHLKKEDELFFKLEAPIYAKEVQHSLSNYEWKNKKLYDEKFESNPNLNNYKFFKVIDTYSAFQAIQTYIPGVLGSKENELVKVSNASKIVKAGFDLKTSFRKDKEK